MTRLQALAAGSILAGAAFAGGGASAATICFAFQDLETEFSLTNFLHVDPHLLTAAARASDAAPSQAIDKAALAAWIRALPPHEKDTLLLNAALGAAPQLGPALLARHRATCRATAEPSTAARDRRTPARCQASRHRRRRR